MDLRVTAKTTVANLIRFGSGMFAFAMTPFLVRTLTGDEYSVWVLALQITGYVSLLEVGISTAVIRFVAPHATPTGAKEQAHHVMRASLAIEVALAMVGVVASGILAALLPQIFPNVPDDLIGPGRAGFVLIGVSSSLHLVVSPLAGYFNAVQRNLRPSSAVFVVRLLAAVAVVAVSRWGLVAMFTASAAGLVVNLIVQYAMFHADLVGFRFIGDRLDRGQLRELMGYCSTLVIWSSAGFLVSGLDTTVVGAFDFEKVGAYGVAASALAIMAGVHSAVLSSFVPDVSRAFGHDDRAGVEHAVRAAMRFANLIAMLSVGAVVGFGRPALRVWAGDGTGGAAFSILVMLTIGKAAGNVMAPYVVGLIGTGDHKRVRTTPLIEGITNLAVSVPATIHFGAIGAAVGTVIGSLLGSLLHLFVNVPRTKAFSFDRRLFVRDGVLVPALAAAPLGCVVLVGHLPSLPVQVVAGIALVGLSTLLSANVVRGVRGKAVTAG